MLLQVLIDVEATLLDGQADLAKLTSLSDAAENAIEEIKQDLSHGPTLREVTTKD